MYARFLSVHAFEIDAELHAEECYSLDLVQDPVNCLQMANAE